jgi:hypothetical protein
MDHALLHITGNSEPRQHIKVRSNQELFNECESTTNEQYETFKLSLLKKYKELTLQTQETKAPCSIVVPSQESIAPCSIPIHSQESKARYWVSASASTSGMIKSRDFRISTKVLDSDKRVNVLMYKNYEYYMEHSQQKFTNWRCRFRVSQDLFS